LDVTSCDRHQSAGTACPSPTAVTSTITQKCGARTYHSAWLCGNWIHV